MPRYLFLIFILLPHVARAQGTIPQIIRDTTDIIIRRVIPIAMLIAVAVFGWGIAKLIAAAGNTQKVDEAKGIIWWGVIALFVLAAINATIYFIQTYIGTPGGGSVTPPQFTPI